MSDDLVIQSGSPAVRGRQLIDDARKALDEVRCTPETISTLVDPGVALVRQLGDADFEQFLVRVHSDPKLRRAAEVLERALNRMTKAAESHLRLVDDLEPGEARCLRDALCAPEEWPGYPIPPGWEVNDNGIYKIEPAPGGSTTLVLVSNEPVMPIAITVDRASGRESIVLGYRRHGRWREVRIPREHTGDPRALLAYRAEGLSVNSITAKNWVMFLDSVEVCSGHRIPTTEHTDRVGWHGDIYVTGPGSGIEISDPTGAKSGWTQSGTWEGWLSAINHASRSPIPWIILYAACAAPALRWIRPGHNPVIDLSGPRGRGKSTWLRMAGSGWGRSDDGAGSTIYGWDTTYTHLERLAAATNDAPLLLDESMRVRSNFSVGQAIYTLAQGHGGGRGSIAGVQRTGEWTNVIISTGEAPLVEHTEAGGARARVISLVEDRPVTTANREQGFRIEAGILANHGHLAPRLAERAHFIASDLRARYETRLTHWSTYVVADTRLLSTAALIDVGSWLAAEVGIPEPKADWRTALIDAISSSVTEADQGQRALDLVRDLFASSSAKFVGRRPGAAEPSGGWLGLWPDDVRRAKTTEDKRCIGVYPSRLDEILRAAGHDPYPVLAQWIEAGIVVRDAKRRTKDMWNPASGRKERVFAFLMSKVLLDS
ncbi:MAG: DUF927 domain-containing protein [Hyphomicrobium sp.]|nr:DUF927 domain-containing protein [Hyphomicrobium sp.]